MILHRDNLNHYLAARVVSGYEIIGSAGVAELDVRDALVFLTLCFV